MKNLFIIAILLAFVSCNSGEKQTDETEAMDHSMGTDAMANDTTPGDSNLLADEDLEKFRQISADVSDKMVDAYLKIKDALVETNGKNAQESAKEAQVELEDAGDGEAVTLLKEEIDQIASTESVEHQREHFNNLSVHMYAMVKANEKVDMTLYRQYCPMAFDNTGAFWLSSSEEIRNPYFGDKMLKCGKVEETISSN